MRAGIKPAPTVKNFFHTKSSAKLDKIHKLDPDFDLEKAEEKEK